jgi:hypothetical protein
MKTNKRTGPYPKFHAGFSSPRSKKFTREPKWTDETLGHLQTVLYKSCATGFCFTTSFHCTRLTHSDVKLWLNRIQDIVRCYFKSSLMVVCTVQSCWPPLTNEENEKVLSMSSSTKELNPLEYSKRTRFSHYSFSIRQKINYSVIDVLHSI